MRNYSLNRRVRKAGDEPKFLRLARRGILPSERFTGGSHLQQVPKSLSNPASLSRKLLSLLAHLRKTTGGHYTAKELALLFLDKYGTGHNLAPRLSELATLDLVERIPVDNKTGKWALRAGVPVNDTKKLLKLAAKNLAKLKNSKRLQAKPSNLPMHQVSASDMLRGAKNV